MLCCSPVGTFETTQPVWRQQTHSDDACLYFIWYFPFYVFYCFSCLLVFFFFSYLCLCLCLSFASQSISIKVQANFRFLSLSLSPLIYQISVYFAVTTCPSVCVYVCLCVVIIACNLPLQAGVIINQQQQQTVGKNTRNKNNRCLAAAVVVIAVSLCHSFRISFRKSSFIALGTHSGSQTHTCKAVFACVCVYIMHFIAILFAHFFFFLPELGTALWFMQRSVESGSIAASCD